MAGPGGGIPLSDGMPGRKHARQPGADVPELLQAYQLRDGIVVRFDAVAGALERLARLGPARASVTAWSCVPWPVNTGTSRFAACVSSASLSAMGRQHDGVGKLWHGAERVVLGGYLAASSVTAMQSISMSNGHGQEPTLTNVRAGGSLLK